MVSLLKKIAFLLAFSAPLAAQVLTVPNGGTGKTTLTNHGPVIGQGTGAVNAASPGTSGDCFVSNGASSDPTFQACPGGGGSVTAVTGVSPIVSSGGTAPAISFASSVMNYAANPNGTSDNSTAFTNACAANNVIYLPAGAYAFTSNYSITCAVQFGAGATVVAPTGVTVTFSGKITASPVTIFTIAGTGKIALGPANTVDYPEWWGALGDNSHDDTTAVQSALNAFVVTGSFVNPYQYVGGGITRIAARTYKTTGTLTITNSQVGIEGVAPDTSLIMLTSASADVLQVNSSACPTTQLGNSVKNVGLSRSLSPTGTANGLAAWCALRLTLLQNEVMDSVRGFYLNGVGSGGAGIIDSNVVGYYYATAGTYYGFYVDGSRENPSLRLRYNTVANNIGSALHVYGTYMTGANLNDLMEYGGETAGVDYGVYVNGASISGSIAGSDIHFSHDVHDQYRQSAYYFTNVPLVNGASIEISEPALGSTISAFPGIDLESTNGVHIVGGTYSHVAGTVFKVNGGSSNSIVATDINQTQVAGSPGGPILYMNSTASNTVTGNAWYMPSGNTQNLATWTSVTRSVFIGNTLSGYTTGTGVALDSASTNNMMFPNTIDPTHISTPYSDASGGATNVWAPLTNPMTTTGDFIVAGSSGTPTRLAAGSTSGYVLTSNGAGAAPSYQAVSATGGVTTLNSLAGALNIVAGTNITVTPSGTNITIDATGGGGSGQTLSPGVPNSGTIPDISTWTAVNSATLVSQTGGAGNPALISLTNSASLNWRGFKTSLPSAPYSVIVRLNTSQQLLNTTTTGLYFFDSSNKMAGPELLMQNTGPISIRIHKGTSPTNDSTDTPTVQPFWPGMGYLCIAQDTSSAHQIYYSSFDGKNWIQILSETTGTFLTPTGIGFGGIDIVAGGADMYEALVYYRTTANSTCQ